jgi:hypothetical protein
MKAIRWIMVICFTVAMIYFGYRIVNCQTTPYAGMFQILAFAFCAWKTLDVMERKQESK